ncbi:unnamed protein product [Acanthoscelides obtectus]|uniref:Uncharacterized protein n=1 Tax=Acanthoscelides obtectus TaxID=200917 RepID=A0A9P0LYL9_ACAOB|nr:unnamed protein product [Acanthoscelides obtectus]CAK1633296.1 hypothetical protein AOBTE_LOCUS8025 [Acanthoscelides obtectus]
MPEHCGCYDDRKEILLIRFLNCLRLVELGKASSCRLFHNLDPLGTKERSYRPVLDVRSSTRLGWDAKVRRV